MDARRPGTIPTANGIGFPRRQGHTAVSAGKRRTGMTDRLLPGHEKQPANPLPLGPRPGTKIHVEDDDTWESIAKRNKVSVKELIANNCGLDATPEEINWYLHRRVGCKVSKDGGRNWSFSRSADP